MPVRPPLSGSSTLISQFVRGDQLHAGERRLVNHNIWAHTMHDESAAERVDEWVSLWEISAGLTHSHHGRTNRRAGKGSLDSRTAAWAVTMPDGAEEQESTAEVAVASPRTVMARANRGPRIPVVMRKAMFSDKLVRSRPPLPLAHLPSDPFAFA